VQGRQLSLVILLPNKRTGLAELEKRMETEDLSELMKKAGNRELELYLPKFKMEVTLNLNEPLKKVSQSKLVIVKVLLFCKPDCQGLHC
jgi:serpin B